MADVNPIPDGYPTLTPYLIVDDAQAAVDFYTKILGASERMRMDAPGGKIGHSELQIGAGLVMLADEHPDIGALSPKTVGGTSVYLHLYVDNVDAVYASALEAGATAVQEPQDQFYGDRSAVFKDPFGHQWSVSTHVEDVPPDEMARRMAAMSEGAEGDGDD